MTDPPLVDGLVDVARTAIIELLGVLERRWESRRRSASMAHDFRALARFFAGAPGNEEAHALFAAAFGLWPARHAHLVRWTAGTVAVDTLGRHRAGQGRTGPADTGTLAPRTHPADHRSPHVRAARQREQAERLAHDRSCELRSYRRGGTPVRVRPARPEEFPELLHCSPPGWTRRATTTESDAHCPPTARRGRLTRSGRRTGRILVTDDGECMRQTARHHQVIRAQIDSPREATSG